MRRFYTLLAREVRGYFHSPIGYIVVVFFLLVTGVNYYFQISFMNQRPASYSVQEAFFNNVFFWLPFILIFQKITQQPAANSAGAYCGSYLMVLLLGMFYLSVGCLASVLTKNQIVAAIISFCAI